MTVRGHVLQAPDPTVVEQLGAQLAQRLPAPCVIYLHGELGAGKTTLVRGYLRALGYRGPVKSPTYTLLEPYSVADKIIYHMDLYRMADPEELEYIGLRDLLGADSVCLIEWPERGVGALPQPDLEVFIAYAQDGGRRLVVEARQTLLDRLDLQNSNLSAWWR